ncbi:elongation factor Tu GTP binding domain-containing protein [Botrytis cinerea]
MDDLYDEFGNFIGEAEESDEESQHGNDASAYVYDEYPEEAPEEPTGQELMDLDDEGPSNAVILHEDKQYYPTAQQVYGEDVETMVQEEDAQPLTQPIIAPVEQKKFNIQEADLPPKYCFCWHLHHGKTAFMDMLVLETHDIAERLEKKTGRKKDEQLRYTDIHVVERERGLSIKSAPMSLVLQSTKGKSHLLNILDTPGHVNFVDEVASSLRLVDGVVLVVDVVEGVQVNTERIIKHAVLEGLPLTLVVNKMDRLILELKLPPTDAYFKLKHVIEEVNTVIEATLPGQGESRRLSPEKAMFCLPVPKNRGPGLNNEESGINAHEFARRLWGDIFYNPSRRSFTRKGVEERSKRSFTDANVLLKLVCEQFFGPSTGFVDMVIQHIPSPVEAAEKNLERHYTGPLDTTVGTAMKNCDQDGPLVIQITKLLNTIDATGFYSFGRVLSGIARAGTQVRVLGEGYSIDDEEDMSVATISDVWIAETRYNIPTDGVPAGNWVLLGGVDNSIVKSATIVPLVLPNEEEAYIFRPITHFTESVFKVAVEPINPSELPKMLDGLRKINKSYPLITTKVEESGEHVILGTGELYMDCVLHDLRRLYAEMEIKVSDPVTRFCETVVETSAIKCYAQTPNKKNKITMVAEPLDQGIAEDIESGKVSIKSPARVIGKYFEENYGWDLLASRSIWAFGPDDLGPNILQDDTIPSEASTFQEAPVRLPLVDKKSLLSVRDTIRQGFSWAAREGPLCEEPIRNSKFKITDVILAPEAIFRGGGQIIPTSRRACYSSFLMASPRLMEPVYSCSMTGPADSVTSLYTVLARRRGHVLSDGPIAGTPLYRVSGLIPVIDSFGFETDLRIHTQGQATVSLVFDRWSIVPGDPLDKDVILRPLEPAGAQATARDFVLKTRRRKGLSEDVSVAKFLEPELFASLKETGILDG